MKKYTRRWIDTPASFDHHFSKYINCWKQKVTLQQILPPTAPPLAWESLEGKQMHMQGVLLKFEYEPALKMEDTVFTAKE